MPTPKPKTDEKEKDFINRCMSDKTMLEEFPDQEKRAGVCHAQLKEELKKEESFDCECIECGHKTTSEEHCKDLICPECGGKTRRLERPGTGQKFEKTIEKKEVYDINDFEIFKVGTWHKQKYTEKDLDDIVESFAEIGAEIKPFLKLGHEENQKILQKEGWPAIGWITNLRREGEALIAKISSMPKKIYELINKKAYGRASSEIYFNLQMGKKRYPRVLRAVALLGAETPEVTTLDDFINLYQHDNYEKIHSYQNHDYEKIEYCDLTKEEEGKMDFEKEVKKLKEQIEKMTKENVESVKKSELIAKENETLKEEKEKFAHDKREDEVRTYVKEKIKEGKVLPSQEEYYISVALGDNDELVYYSKDEKKEIKGDRFAFLKTIIENNPNIVEMEEKSRHIEKKHVEKFSSFKTEEERGEYLDAEIKKLMKDDNSLTYSDAYSAVVEELGEDT